MQVLGEFRGTYGCGKVGELLKNTLNKSIMLFLSGQFHKNN